MNTQKKPQTAAEFMAELNANPVFQAAQAEREKIHLAKVAE
jgi:hypothetical protein